MDDLISRQEAIDALNKIFPADPMRNDYTQGITCGAALATEYIKQLPSAQPETHDKRTKTHSCDCISRQAAMEEISKQQTYKMFEGEDTLYLDANDVGSVLASLPSAQPEHTNSWYINSWCIGCKEYDHERKCCPRYNRVIRQTLDEAYAHGETEAESRFHDEIVRCRDCKYNSNTCGNYVNCDIIPQMFGRTVDNFCSRAERRTDEGD